MDMAPYTASSTGIGLLAVVLLSTRRQLPEDLEAAGVTRRGRFFDGRSSSALSVGSAGDVLGKTAGRSR